MHAQSALLGAVALLAAMQCASAFSVGTIGAPALSLRSTHVSSRASQFVGASSLGLRAPMPKSRASSGITSIKAVLFGLGWPELAVIGVVVALIFGPSNIAGLGKDLGKLAGSIKKEAGTFSEAMNESLKEAEKEYKKGEDEADAPAPKAKEDKPVPKKKVDLSDN